ncbi:MAG: stage II sporulation protein R [Eubacteriales bacterium]|nr:stage II sporulation protein R [Eubacteriales bacterium]
MKLFRDMFAAILIGVVGGLAVSVFSYYQNHKEGGLLQTASAVVNSFNTVATAYAGEEQKALAVSAMMPEDGEALSYDGILRFHVRANSDQKKDQELKLAVKDDVLQFLKPRLEECENVTESRTVLLENLQNIYTIAKKKVEEQGYDYPIAVYMTKEEFPAKEYGDLTFPAGEYQALRIDIGEAQGKNWWCVMFPPLCFVDSSTAVVTQEGKEALKHALTQEEFRMLFKQGIENEDDITIRRESYFYNWWKEHQKEK